MRESKDKAMPPRLDQVRKAALKALGPLEAAGPPGSDAEAKALFLSSRTRGGQKLPAYYLVYLLLVDLLQFTDLGPGEKLAWQVPVRLSGRLYSIAYRKFGLGVFSPHLDPDAQTNVPPDEVAEADASHIAALVSAAVQAATLYFEWRAAQAASSNELNVKNKNDELFARYAYFRDLYYALTKKADLEKGGQNIAGEYELRREAEWSGQAAVEAFFSWTEHAFIHLAILQGRLSSGDDVAKLAGAEWKEKFKVVLDIFEVETKRHYDSLLELRTQVRNFMAHGAFGKRGEAMSFHSGTGAVPLLLTGHTTRRFSLTGQQAFEEQSAISAIEDFIRHLWSGPREPAREYIFSGHPGILTLVGDGTYARAMRSADKMSKFLEFLDRWSDDAANMDW